MVFVIACHEFLKAKLSPHIPFAEFPQRSKGQKFFRDDYNLHSCPHRQLSIKEIPGNLVIHNLPQTSPGNWQYTKRKSITQFKCLMLTQEEFGMPRIWQGLKAGFNPASHYHQSGNLSPDLRVLWGLPEGTYIFLSSVGQTLQTE